MSKELPYRPLLLFDVQYSIFDIAVPTYIRTLVQSNAFFQSLESIESFELLSPGNDRTTDRSNNRTQLVVTRLLHSLRDSSVDPRRSRAAQRCSTPEAAT